MTTNMIKEIMKKTAHDPNCISVTPRLVCRRRAVAQHCINGDSPSQGEGKKLTLQSTESIEKMVQLVTFARLHFT